jgi:HSP20 family protein
MATQTTKPGQQTQPEGQSGGQGSQVEGTRRSGFPVTLALAPGDFFRMNPFSLMRRLTEEMDSFFGETRRGEERERIWAPAIEISQKQDSYVVRAELPGVRQGDVKIEITDEGIVIQGERKLEQEETKGGMHLTERRYGRFYRAVPLPEGAKTEEAQAKFDNGVLEITVPLQDQESKRREIPIQGSPASKAA